MNSFSFIAISIYSLCCRFDEHGTGQMCGENCSTLCLLGCCAPAQFWIFVKGFFRSFHALTRNIICYWPSWRIKSFEPVFFETQRHCLCSDAELAYLFLWHQITWTPHSKQVKPNQLMLIQSLHNSVPFFCCCCFLLFLSDKFQATNASHQKLWRVGAKTKKKVEKQHAKRKRRHYKTLYE